MTKANSLQNPIARFHYDIENALTIMLKSGSFILALAKSFLNKPASNIAQSNFFQPNPLQAQVERAILNLECCIQLVEVLYGDTPETRTFKKHCEKAINALKSDTATACPAPASSNMART